MRQTLLLIRTKKSKHQYPAGLEKHLNFSLPFGQVALKFCLPWAGLRLLFLQFSWQMTWPGPLPIGQVRMKSDLPDRKIYLCRTTGRHFFLALPCVGQHPLIL